MKSKRDWGYRPVTARTIAAIRTRIPIRPPPPQLKSWLPSRHAAQVPPPANNPTMMYCGMASSHHFTRTSPRDSRSG